MHDHQTRSQVVAKTRITRVQRYVDPETGDVFSTIAQKAKSSD